MTGKAAKITVSRLTLSKILMAATIVLIAAFQVYWISKLYKEESDSLKKETDIAFRDVMYRLQLQRFKNDTTFLKAGKAGDNLFMFDVIDSVKHRLQDTPVLKKKGAGFRKFTISVETNEQHDTNLNNPDEVIKRINTMQEQLPAPPGGLPHVVKYFSSHGTGINIPLDVKQVDSAYKVELLKSGITIPCTVQMIKGKADDIEKNMPGAPLKTSFIFVGLSNAYAYQATFGSPVSYIAGKLRLPVLVGLLLLGFTIISFVFLYRNLLAQKRLAAVKNEFISNITHELKTPIATVNVAVEALRNFNALQNPERTREYLDISALELQRLSMLVDKVLKLSMFENKEIELNKEDVDLHQLAAEVIAGMKLQLEKAGAVIQLTTTGDGFTIQADKLHITSVLYNLLDNALKYSRESPAIDIHLLRETHFVAITVTDNGIGIPAAYKNKIFDKFFRVPSGNHHNIKGYGLGLSYVHHIVMQHGGLINVESTEGRGSTFTIKLPLFNVKTVSI